MVASESYQMDPTMQVNQNYTAPSDNYINDVIYKMPDMNESDVESVSKDSVSKINEDLRFSGNESNSQKGLGSLTEEEPNDILITRPKVRPNPPPSHTRIRRIPSTANPKHRTPLLYKNQRSQSSPQLQSLIQNTKQRRGSLPQTNNSKIAPVHPRRNSSPNLRNLNPVYQELLRQKGQIQQQILQQTQTNQSSQNLQKSQANSNVQQQVIYIQIPNMPQAQDYDSQVLQSQISTQLQQLVPQIYSQLVNNYGQTQNAINNDRSKSPTTFSLSSGSSTESFVSQSGEGSNPEISAHRKRKKSVDSKPDTFQIINEKQSADTTVLKNGVAYQQSEIPLLLQPEQLQQASIDLQHATGIPQITIPLSQELLLQCQQLRDPGITAYQPRLETIQEEAMSIKRGPGMVVSKSKIFACILTVLSVIVVVVLAGDRTVAVVVVTVLFLIFFLGLVGFLYLNSARSSGRGFTP